MEVTGELSLNIKQEDTDPKPVECTLLLSPFGEDDAMLPQKKYVLSQDDEDKAILSQDGEDNGLQSCDSEDSVSFSENSEEEYDDLPLLSDDEYVSQPPENSVDFFQMELDAEHTEKEQVHKTNKHNSFWKFPLCRIEMLPNL